MFLSSDPAGAAQRALDPVTGLASVGRFLLPAGLFTLGQRARADAPRPAFGPFPPGQLMCVDRVLEAAKATGRSVSLVDVNEPGLDGNLVAELLGAWDVLPVLVRSDRTRLVGEESFTPHALRRFLSST